MEFDAMGVGLVKIERNGRVGGVTMTRGDRRVWGEARHYIG